MDPFGNEVTALDEAQLRDSVERLRAEGVASVAVCFLHAYANDAHERRARKIIREMAPDWLLSLSSEVLPEIKEYERTSTTVINAYVQPPVDRYARLMERDMAGLGVDAPIMVMQSNGGMMPLSAARAFPIHIIESGPAAGVTGAYHLARRMGLRDVVTLDMGGTTAKAAMIQDGEICRSPEYEVGGEVSIGHRLMKGSGYLLRCRRSTWPRSELGAAASPGRTRREPSRLGLRVRGRPRDRLATGMAVSSHDHRCECLPGADQSAIPRRWNPADPSPPGGEGDSGSGRRTTGHGHHRDRLGHTQHRQLKSYPCSAGGVDRARVRSTRFHFVRVWRYGPGARSRRGG